MNINVNFFAIASFLLSITSLLQAIIVFIFRKSNLHRVWALFNLSVGFWATGAVIISQLHDPELALIAWRLTEISVAFIAIFFLHVTMIVCNIRARHLLKLAYIQGFMFSILSLYSPQFFSSVVLVFNSFYYARIGYIFYPFFLIWMSLVSYSQFKLFYTFFYSSGKHRNQLLYFIVATLVGFTGGATNFFPHFGLSLYPWGNATIILYCLIVSYAILRHNLLDINVFFTRTGIFIAVYSVVLGIPYALAFSGRERLQSLIGMNWWIVPMSCLTVLATVGPFLYLYIQKRAEEQILKEQRRYQATLSQASSGMGRIKDLKRLLALIVYVITRAVRLEHSSVYIYDNDNNRFILGAYKRNIDKDIINVVSTNSSLVTHLIETHAPVVYEEIRQKVEEYNDTSLLMIEKDLRSLDAALVIPSLIEDRLLAILVLGKKKSGKLYGEDDLSVFTILANQAALAIENAQFYEDVKKTQEQLFQAEKMATIGTMADGLSHQINNRLHALGFIAGDALDTLKMKRNAATLDDVKEVMTDLEHSLTRIQENVVQGGEIVQGLLRYTRKGEEGFAPVEIDRLVTAALEMAQFKIKTHELKILREYDLKGPKIKGNFTQLQEVFFNMIDNAYDAMMQRKNEHKEPGYQPTLRIQSETYDDRIVVKFVDNGIGVKPEDFQKIFTPFFTTKLSSKKGTGLGLYVIKKIVDENHKGKVSFSSKYLEGTTMKIDLPAVKG